MTIPFETDIPLFFNTDELAETAVYLRESDDTNYADTNVDGYYDEDYQKFEKNDGGVETSSPAFRCREADVPNASNLDRLTVRGRVFQVNEVQPDGAGIVVLLLGED